MQIFRATVLSTIAVFFITSGLFAQSKQSLPCLDKKFSIIVNILHDSTGQPGIILQDVLDGIDAANIAWSEICV